MPWYVNSLFGQAAAANESGPSLWPYHLLAALVVLALSVFLGDYLGKKLRMPDHGWKIGLTLFSFLVSIAILFTSPPLKLGIDLRGGVYLVYEVDPRPIPRRSPIRWTT